MHPLTSQQHPDALISLFDRRANGGRSVGGDYFGGICLPLTDEGDELVTYNDDSLYPGAVLSDTVSPEEVDQLKTKIQLRLFVQAGILLSLAAEFGLMESVAVVKLVSATSGVTV
jgi:hypothetical protein